MLLWLICVSELWPVDLRWHIQYWRHCAGICNASRCVTCVAWWSVAALCEDSDSWHDQTQTWCFSVRVTSLHMLRRTVRNCSDLTFWNHVFTFLHILKLLCASTIYNYLIYHNIWLLVVISECGQKLCHKCREELMISGLVRVLLVPSNDYDYDAEVYAFHSFDKCSDGTYYDNVLFVCPYVCSVCYHFWKVKDQGLGSQPLCQSACSFSRWKCQPVQYTCRFCKPSLLVWRRRYTKTAEQIEVLVWGEDSWELGAPCIRWGSQ